MLRMYLMQIWFNLSDEGIEDSIYDSYAMRSFMHIDFNEQQVPDATALLKFRHTLEANKLGEKFFADVNNRLDKAGLMMHGGTIAGTSLIAAPKSTKNQDGKRDPEMHQTKKVNKWYFGMKVHAGVDAGSGYVHTITCTSANMHDFSETANFIREDDEVVYVDSGYLGAVNQPAIKDDEKKSRIEFRVNRPPFRLKMVDDFKGLNWDKEMEHEKFAVHCKVEHPLLIVKKQMKYSKAVYRGIAKNMHRFHMLFASANLLMCSRAGRVMTTRKTGGMLCPYKGFAGRALRLPKYASIASVPTANFIGGGVRPSTAHRTFCCLALSSSSLIFITNFYRKYRLHLLFHSKGKLF